MNFKTLINNIENLTDKEKRHVLSIFQKYNMDEYTTKNNNGYFINLSKVPEYIINKIEKCVNLIEEHRDLIEKLDNQREVYLDYYKTLIENKLNETIENKRLEYTKYLLINEEEIFSIKKKKSKNRHSDIDVDPDLLIKEYIKSKKLKKGSVWYNIIQKCNNRKSRFKETDEDNNDNINTHDDDLNVYDDDRDGGDFDGGGDNRHGDEDELIEQIANEEIANNEEVDEIEIDEIEVDDEYYKSENGSNDSDDEKENITTIDTGNISKNTISMSKLSFYKSLLKKKHGFTFNDDRYVKMKKEEYLL